MADSPGTLEHVAVELAQAVGSLRHWVSEEHVLDLLAEFGVRFPDEILSESAFADSLAEVQVAVETLDEAAATLGAAMASPSGAASLGAATLAVHDAARSTLDSVQGLGDTIDSVGRTATDIPDAEIDRLVDGFSQKLLHLLIVDQLDIIPVIGEVLTLIGLIDRVEHDGVDTSIAEPAWTERTLRFDRTGRLLSDAAAFFEEKYGWGSMAFDGGRLFDELGASLSRLGVPSLLLDDPQAGPPTLEALVLNVSVDASSEPPGLTLSAISPLNWDVLIHRALPIPSWTFEFSGRGSLEPGMEVTVRPPLQVELAQGSGAEIELDLALSGFDENGFLLLGPSAANGLSAKGVELRANLLVDGNEARELTVTGLLTEGRLSIDPAEADGFISSLVAGIRLESDFELAFSWTLSDGLRLDGGAGLVRDIFVGARRGPVEIPVIRLAAEFASDGTLSSEFMASIATDLGIFALVIEHMGFSVDLEFREDGSGNAGILQLDIAFRPPDGVGLVVDAGVVTGGGFLYVDPEGGGYSGVLELELLEVGIGAIGIIDTKLPDGRWSMFLSLFASFTALQLGFGFTLNGVGGLVGVNRGLDEEALADGVRCGALDSILFPEDPVANAPRILADMAAVFPPAEGQFVFGPVVKLGWGTPTLIEADLGVVIQLPEPLTISLLGSLAAVLPEEDAAVVVLRVDVAGTANLIEGTLKVDAALRDSQVAGLALSGSLALRASLLDNPSFLFSFGGFHPAFEPPQGFPRIARLGIGLDTGDELRITLGGYFAVSSSTVQFGAICELWAKAAGFTAEGGTSFDALIIFKPFGFIVALRAWVSISVGQQELFSVLLAGELQGPNRWHVTGLATFRLLGLKESLEVEARFGSAEDEDPREVVDVAKLLIEALRDPAAWSVVPVAGAGPGVVLAATDTDALRAHPAGAIEVRQRILPLRRRIDHYGNAKLSGADQFALSEARVGSRTVAAADVEDWFAAAQYWEMKDAERLSAPSFELMAAGLRLEGGGVSGGAARPFTCDYEVKVRDPAVRKARPSRPGAVIPARALPSRSRMARRRPRGLAAILPGARSARRGPRVAEVLFVSLDVRTGRAPEGARPERFYAARERRERSAAARSLALAPAYEQRLD